MNSQKNVAAENFLISLDRSYPKYTHILNANLDAQRYGWDWDTFKEILDGIDEIYDKIRY